MCPFVRAETKPIVCANQRKLDLGLFRQKYCRSKMANELRLST